MGFVIREDVDGTFDIDRRGHRVGRIRGRTIELRGFQSVAEAERAVAAVSSALARWLSLQHNGSRSSQRLVVRRLWPEIGRLWFEVTLPMEIEPHQVLRAARTAYHAAFGNGTRLEPRREAVASVA